MGPVRVELVRSGEVGVEAHRGPGVRRGHLGKVVGCAGRRRRAAQVAGQEAAAGAVETQVEVHFLERAAGQQRGLVDAPQAYAEAGAHDLEHVGRHVVAIRPYAQFRIVAKEVAGENTGVDLHGVEVPATGHRVAGLGDCDTFVVRTGVLIEPGEVRDDPAVDQRVVEHHRVAAVAGVARAAGRAGEKGVEGYRRDGSAGGLVVDADRRVDGLDVMVGADVAVGVGRPASAVRVNCMPAKLALGGGAGSCAPVAGPVRWVDRWVASASRAFISIGVRRAGMMSGASPPAASAAVIGGSARRSPFQTVG